MKSPVNANLEKLKLLGTIVMAVSLPFSESLKLVSIFFTLAILLLQLYRKETTIELSIIHYGFIFLLLSALLSSAYAVNLAKSLKGVEGILYYTIPFFIACSINSKNHVRIILWSLYISTAAASVFGIFHSFQINKALEIHSLGNQNYTAMYLIIVLSSMVSAFVFSEREKQTSRIIVCALAIPILIASVMTAMRTSFIAFVLFMSFLLYNQRGQKTVRLLAVIITVILVSSVYLYKPMLGKLFATTSLESRFYIWEYAVKTFVENPVFGTGLNHFKYISSPNFPEAGNILFDAHNVYLQTASQMGTLGLVSLLIIMFGLIYKFMKFKAASDFDNTIKYSALGGFLVTFIGGIFDTTLHHEHAIAFTLLTGLMFALSSKDDK